MTNEQLDILLERQGRDNTIITFNSSKSNIKSSEVEQVVDMCNPVKIEASETSTALLMTEKPRLGVSLSEMRLSALPEIDLRQLEDVLYKANLKGSKSIHSVDGIDIDYSNVGDDADIPTKRVRKDRIVMVDATGSGYGGLVPMLAEYMDTKAITNSSSSSGANDDEDKGFSRRRGRTWYHMDHCCLCGQRDKPAPPPATVLSGHKRKARKVHNNAIVMIPEAVNIKCAHCPLVFHESCLSGKAGTKQG
jgi:hypothetical protein